MTPASTITMAMPKISAVICISATDFKNQNNHGCKKHTVTQNFQSDLLQRNHFFTHYTILPRTARKNSAPKPIRAQKPAVSMIVIRFSSLLFMMQYHLI